MKIRDFKYGLMVEQVDEDYFPKGYGILVGITNNIPSCSTQERAEKSRAIFEVKWQTGEITSIHPTNVKRV